MLLLTLVVGAIFLYEQQGLRSTDYASDDEAAVAALREIYEQLCTDAGDGRIARSPRRGHTRARAITVGSGCREGDRATNG